MDPYLGLYNFLPNKHFLTVSLLLNLFLFRLGFIWVEYHVRQVYSRLQIREPPNSY